MQKQNAKQNKMQNKKQNEKQNEEIDRMCKKYVNQFTQSSLSKNAKGLLIFVKPSLYVLKSTWCVLLPK